MGHMEAALRRLRALCRRLARGLDPTAPPKNEAPVDPTTPSSSSAAPQDAGVLSSPLRGGAWQKAGGGGGGALPVHWGGKASRTTGEFCTPNPLNPDVTVTPATSDSFSCPTFQPIFEVTDMDPPFVRS